MKRKFMALICVVPVIAAQLGLSDVAIGVEAEAVSESLSLRYSVSQHGVNLGSFDSLQEAVAEAKKWNNSVVMDGEEAVWSYGDHLYKVYQGQTYLSQFNSKSSAIAEAKKWADSKVVYERNTVWSFGDDMYRVYQGQTYLSQFNSKSSAIAEAKKWANSKVVYERNTVWNFGDHLYKVYQGQTYLKTFSSKSGAIAEAKKWANSKVVYERNTVWNFGDHLYKVYQGQTYLKTFSSKSSAVSEAKKWANSKVVNEGKTVWKFGDDMYRVLQRGVSLGTFKTLNGAINEAVKWRNSVIEKDGKNVWKFGDERLIGTYTTYFSAGDINRNYNISRSANAINGKTVSPGVTFSFNNATGLRTRSNGYKDSIVISGGKFVMGVGGGVCQTSTTLYNAVLKSGLQTVERHPHSQPISYVPRGKDAAVADYALDFRFRNNTGYPVRIKASTTASSITVSIYGR